MRNMAILLVLVLVSSVSADVCWGEGSPLYEGNYIYSTHSVKTTNNDIYTCWVEQEDALRKLKLHKTDYQGNLLWSEPITIVENSEFMMERNILSCPDNSLFLELGLDYTNQNQLLKVSGDGSLIWSAEYSQGYYEDFLSLDTGGAINVRIGVLDYYYHLFGTYIDADGNVIWDDLDLSVLPDQITNNQITYKGFIDDHLYVMVYIAGYEYLMKFSLDGNHLLTSSPIPSSYESNCKFINDNFYTIYKDYDETLKLWQIDLEGNSVLGNDPVSITSLQSYRYRSILAGDDHFFCVASDNDNIYLIKFDFLGNVQDEYMLDIEGSLYLESYDQETDFINVTCFFEGEHDVFLITIDDEGPSSPIHYLLPSLNYYSLSDKYYINGGFTMTGKVNQGYDFVSTLRNFEGLTALREIKKIEMDYLTPELIPVEGGLHAHWGSYSRSSVMSQNFDYNGEPQLAANGEVLISDGGGYYFWEDYYFCYDILHSNSESDTISFIAYDFEGNQLWVEPCKFTIDNRYHNHVGITPFYNGLLFHIATDTGNWQESEMEAMYLDETGFLWSEPHALDFGYVETYRAYEFMENFLFHEQNGNVRVVILNEDGSCQNQYVLAYSSGIVDVYGTQENFFLKTDSDNFEGYAFYCLRDGISIWEEPLYFDIYTYRSLKPFFADDYFYLTGYNSDHVMEVVQYDYEKNIIPENSFSFNFENPNGYGVFTYLVDNCFVFFIVSYGAEYDQEISYTVYSTEGEQLIAEFEESVIGDIPNIEWIEDIVFEDNCFYLSISTGLKVVEGEYEKNHYVQKIDISALGDDSDKIISSDDTCLQAYPNPFNPEISIEYALSQKQMVDLQIFNLKGQKVTTLIKAEQEAGIHHISWKADEFSSGVYLLKFNTKEVSETRKLILLK